MATASWHWPYELPFCSIIRLKQFRYLPYGLTRSKETAACMNSPCSFISASDKKVLRMLDQFELLRSIDVFHDFVAKFVYDYMKSFHVLTMGVR